MFSEKFKINFGFYSNILILFVLFFGGVVLADTNGVWHKAEDIVPGKVGFDQGAGILNNFTFINPVYFNISVGIGTFAPQEMLHVREYIRSDTGFCIKDNCTETLSHVPNCTQGESLIWNNGKWECYREPDLFLTASQNNVDVYSALGNPSLVREYVVSISSGVIIGSTSTLEPALTTGAFPPGSTVKIINRGRIQGTGGDGGAGGDNSCQAGYPGGPALEITLDATIDNFGEIWGGGGGGASKCGPYSGAGLCGYWTPARGGGGAGSVPGNLGLENSGTSEDGGGYGGAYCAAFSGAGWSPKIYPTGQSGGAPGEAGISVSGRQGGAPGEAILTNGNSLTWINGNSSPNLKGAID